MEDKPFGFLMTTELAEQFFRICLEREAVTHSERVAILRELEAKNQCAEVSLDEVKKKAKGKKVLLVEKKRRTK